MTKPRSAKKGTPAEPAAGAEAVTSELPRGLRPQYAEISEYLRTVRFRKKAFGGVDEADVWRKLGELNALYEKLLIADRAKREGPADE